MGYITEYAKSGRSLCKGCRGLIANGKLRIGNLVQSTRHSGSDLHWFHVGCFASKYPDVTQHQIAKFDGIAVEDQQFMVKCLAGEIKEDPPVPVPVVKKVEVIENSGEFCVEYAKSNRSHCIACEGRIVKDEVRISQKDYKSEKAKRLPYGCLDRWHHVDCFVRNRVALEFFNNAHSINGISWLKKEDIDMLVGKLPRISDAENVTTVNATVEKDTNVSPGPMFPKIDKKPLFNHKFVISDTSSNVKADEIQKKIEEFGGTIVTRVGKQISAIFSTKYEVDSMAKRPIIYAQDNGIPVISYDFIHALSTVGFEFDVVVKRYLLSSWMCGGSSASATSGGGRISMPLATRPSSNNGGTWD